MVDDSSSLWVSDNMGRDWALSNITDSIAKAVLHPYDGSRVILVGTARTHFISTDKGRRYKSFTAPERFSSLDTAFQFNKDLPKALIFNAPSSVRPLMAGIRVSVNWLCAGLLLAERRCVLDEPERDQCAAGACL